MHAVRTMKPDPIHEVWKGLTTKVPRLSRKGVLDYSVYPPSHSGWFCPHFIKGKLRPIGTMTVVTGHIQ